jgi:hypothetical protein
MRIVKTIVRFLFAIALASLTSPALTNASAAPSNEAAPSPGGGGTHLESIAFLVGGVWRGQLPSSAPETKGAPTAVELRCDWSANHQAIRFDGAFIVDGKPLPYTSGLYAWNGSKQKLTFFYTDDEGSLTEGVVEPEKGALVHNFTVTSATGEVSNTRAIITPAGPDHYTNEIFVQKNGAWQKLVAVKYDRIRS